MLVSSNALLSGQLGGEEDSANPSADSMTQLFGIFRSADEIVWAALKAGRPVQREIVLP